MSWRCYNYNLFLRNVVIVTVYNIIILYHASVVLLFTPPPPHHATVAAAASVDDILYFFSLLLLSHIVILILPTYRLLLYCMSVLSTLYTFDSKRIPLSRCLFLNIINSCATHLQQLLYIYEPTVFYSYRNCIFGLPIFPSSYPVLRVFAD